MNIIFKRLKELVHIIYTIPSLHKKLDNIEDLLDKYNVKSSKSQDSFNNILIYDNLNSNYDHYMELLYMSAVTKYNSINESLDSCIFMYDKLLYKSSKDINNIHTLLKYISELKVLREFILHLLFDNKDIFSFYLYFIKTEVLNKTLRALPIINIDKIFMLEDGRIISGIEKENYLILYMDYDKTIITTSKGIFEYDIKYRKTILKVLYSVYMNKFYLYER